MRIPLSDTAMMQLSPESKYSSQTGSYNMENPMCIKACMSNDIVLMIEPSMERRNTSARPCKRRDAANAMSLSPTHVMHLQL